MATPTSSGDIYCGRERLATSSARRWGRSRMPIRLAPARNQLELQTRIARFCRAIHRHAITCMTVQYPQGESKHSVNCGGNDAVLVGAAHQTAQFPDLAEVVAAWSNLSPAVRADILAIVRNKLK